MSAGVLQGLLSRPRPVLLDGAVGTELSRRGVDTTLPLWSARALADARGLEILATLHAEYAQAGAEILVTNTFRTTPRALEKAGFATRWEEFNRRAVDAARTGSRATHGRCLVAGGLAPLEDCYRPDLVPPDTACRDEHGRQAALLARLGVDLIFVETMNCAREARAAAGAAAATGLAVLLSLCPRPPAHLLSGEPLDAVLEGILAAAGPRLRGILVNCATPETLEGVFPLFAPIRPDLPHGLYAHLGEPDDVTGWRLPERHEPERYAAWMEGRIDEGARLVGGCCGTTPDHIAALAGAIGRRASG